MSDPPPPPSLLTWDLSGAPRSRLYGDIYFSAEDGLAESRAVFLTGCGLPEAWADRRDFVVAELGFGTGLNIIALIDLWRRNGPPAGHLSIFSIEAHPLGADEAAAALGRWPEIADLAELLTSRWPGRARGFHRVSLPQYRTTVDVAIMTARDGLAAWDGRADAWFLDGFSPAVNPDMWASEIFDLVAARSAPGGRVATFTAAGPVRRGLAAAGFTVTRRPGFGRKRHRLEARLPGEPDSPATRPRVAVIGAGIAGAALHRAFAALGVSCTVFESGAGASSGPAALVTPRLDAALGDNAALFAQALRRAAQLYETVPDGVIARGATQRPTGPKDPARFEAIAASDLFDPGAMLRTHEGLRIEAARVIDPRRILQAWIAEARTARVASLTRHDAGWRMRDAEGGLLAEADVVCLAAGMDCARLAPGLPLAPVRGQASLATGASWPTATLFGGYVIPSAGGILFGATHDRGDTDAAPREADHARNLAAVAAVLPTLAADLGQRTLRAWSGIRATTRDYLPLAGAVPGDGPGLFVLGGLGSRGFTLAPLLGEHIAAVALGLPSPLPRAQAALVDPGRFARRELRRGRQPAAA